MTSDGGLMVATFINLARVLRNLQSFIEYLSDAGSLEIVSYSNADSFG